MRLFFFSFILISAINSYSGGFQWPNRDYSYAKLYLLNIPFDGPEKLDYSVFENGIFAKSKIGNGIMLSEDLLKAFHGLMSRGVDELIAGLSNCFIPRHGIIYFDKFGTAVASTTICFQCEQINFWSSEEILQHTVDPAQFDIDKAEEQMADLKGLMKFNKIPMFETPEAFDNYVDTAKSYINNGEMFFHENRTDSLFNRNFNKGQVWLWIHEDVRGKNKFEETIELKITGGGDKYMYSQLGDKNGTRFIYSADEHPYLSEAVIVSNEITLPNGVKVGMSLDDVINTFPVYDGIAWPAHINVILPNYTLDYYFERQTLVRIEIASRV
jgi:hypothetical protein